MGKNNTKKGKITAVLCAVLLACMTLCVSLTAYADDGYCLTLIAKSGENAIEGVEWNVYRVAERDGGDFVLCDTFAQSGVALNEIDDASAQDTANTLEAYALTQSVQAVAEVTSDSNGQAKVENLPNGVYLVSGKKITIGSKIYTPSAVLVEVLREDVEVYGKFAIEDVPEQPEMVDFKVEKVWQGIPEDKETPASVTVELYNNNELVETVVLDNSNNWTYEWEGLETDDWKVIETKIDENYTVTYRDDGTEYVVINKYADVNTSTDSSSVTDSSSTPDEPEKPENSSKPDIPQTGLLWWPVPVLALAGVVCVAVGLKAKSEKK